MNEELRMKNEENKRSAFECCASNNPEGARRFANANASQLGVLRNPRHSQVNPEIFMSNHKAFGDACGGRGGKAARFFILNSSFFVPQYPPRVGTGIKSSALMCLGLILKKYLSGSRMSLRGHSRLLAQL